MVAEAQIKEMSREELIVIVHELLKENRILAAEIARWKQPPSTSQNSSLPPSRDFKSDKKKRTRSKKKGAQAGHKKQERELIEKPSKVIEAHVDYCETCHQNLLDEKPVQIVRRQVMELPEIKPVVIETRQYVVDCPCCGKRQHGKLPEGLEAGRYFGPRLEAVVTALHHEHHIGYARLRQICDELFGVKLSAGGAVAIVKRAGKRAKSEAEAIGEQVRQSQVIGSDETSARVHGRNWWEWVFLGDHCEYHTIAPSRGYDVVEKFMQTRQAEVWVSDCWKAQLRAPAQASQICLSHQIRDLQGLIDKRSRLVWASEMQALFRKAIHLKNRRDKMTERGFKRQVSNIERRLSQLLKRTFQGLGRNLLDRYRKHRDSLFVFLHRADVSAHNNACERALRPSVIHRNVLGSFRSDWGAQSYATLATVLNTEKRNGRSAFQKLVQIMGAPVLPFLTQPDFV